MAHEHNLGSVNKTLRDLLAWYRNIDEQDLKRIMGESGRRYSRGSSIEGEVGDVDVGDGVVGWLTEECREFIGKVGGLCGVDGEVVVEGLVAWTRMELDHDEVFENAWCLPRSNEVLYSDLDIYTEVLQGGRKR